MIELQGVWWPAVSLRSYVINNMLLGPVMSKVRLNSDSISILICLECQNYKTLISSARKTSHRTTHTVRCDNLLGLGWYRFQGGAGSRMASSCPPTNRCKTHATGWLNGAHPTVAEGQVSRQACFHWSSNCCHMSIGIKVRNCGAFYIYYLTGTPKSSCNYRYCSMD